MLALALGQCPSGVALDCVEARLKTVIARALTDLDARGVPLPRQVVADATAFAGYDPSDTHALFDPSSDTIYLNPGSWLWRDPGKAGADFSAGEGPMHTLAHEIGHREYYRASPRLYRWAHATAVSEEGRPLIVAHVGSYAATDAGEFVAEVYAGLACGRSYPDSILSRYRRIAGPRPPVAGSRRRAGGSQRRTLP
jgi:hypothetical protein